MVGSFVFSKIMVDECGFLEVWRDFFNIFLRNVVQYIHWN